MLLSREVVANGFSTSNFFLNCGVLDECAAEKLPTFMAFDTEYDSAGAFASDEDSATCGILCELELS